MATIGIWAQTVGAQWLFVDDPNAATIVALVQTATTLPMMMLALPVGALADAFDRRWLLFGVQVDCIAIAVLLAVLTGAGEMSPALLLCADVFGGWRRAGSDGTDVEGNASPSWCRGPSWRRRPGSTWSASTSRARRAPPWPAS